jgi:hypothetical protein
MSTKSSNRLSGKQYFWLQLALLSAGLLGLWLSHQIAGWGEDISTRNIALGTAAVVGFSLAALGRAAQVIVTSAFSDSYRVFLSRHLLACSLVLFTGATFAAGPAVHEPFDRLLSHGRITGGEIADVGSMIAVTICTVGAVVTSMGAWDAFHDERHWYRSLHSGGQ